MPDIFSTLTSTVVFLFAQGGQIPIGTAFVVGLPVPDKDGAIVPVIVTARHVLGDHQKVVARFSTQEGNQPLGVEFDLAKLREEGDFWPHPDDGVDIVAFRTPHFENTRYAPIPLDLVASREVVQSEDIKQSDRVVFPCLLVNFMGQARNYPVLKDGSIALIPEENVAMEYVVGSRNISTRQSVIFLNAISIPGASGSPVFLLPGPRIKANAFNLGGGKPFLLGIMHGFYPAAPRDVIEIQTSEVRRLFQENSGIAIVFPSWRLREILESARVKERMRALLAVAK